MHQDAHPGSHDTEIEAQRFAAAFLMPGESFSREFPQRLQWPALFKLKERWQVSLQSILYRGRTLGLLSPDAYRRGQVRLSKEGWRTREPLDLGPPESPTVVQRSLQLMEQELGINSAILAREARLTDQVFDELIRDVLDPAPTLISLVPELGH
jgi:Zn-dependent peptidase ImmA (M78 family)